MMILYHGSDQEVDKPLAKVGRKNLDFGRGFYVTRLEGQAKNWAKVIAGRKGRNVIPVVSVYEFDRTGALGAGVRFKTFESYDLEWLDYVVNCRKGRSVFKDFDVVEGGVADDDVIDTVEDYEKKIITAEQALGQLQYKKVNHQICFLDQSVIDRYLSFKGSSTL